VGKFFLLADDDNDDADLFREALSSIDPPVDFHHVEDGEMIFQFLETIQGKKPDIIFLDLNMPGMNGWQCLAKLKNDNDFKDIPVIMYSTSSHQRDKEIANELGALGFITKPFDYKIVKVILSKIAQADGNLQEIVNKFR
jgi:CheY-like chemotaxis protein